MATLNEKRQTVLDFIADIMPESADYGKGKNFLELARPATAGDSRITSIERTPDRQILLNTDGNPLRLIDLADAAVDDLYRSLLTEVISDDIKEGKGNSLALPRPGSILHKGEEVPVESISVWNTEGGTSVRFHGPEGNDKTVTMDDLGFDALRNVSRIIEENTGIVYDRHRESEEHPDRWYVSVGTLSKESTGRDKELFDKMKGAVTSLFSGKGSEEDDSKSLETLKESAKAYDTILNQSFKLSDVHKDAMTPEMTESGAMRIGSGDGDTLLYSPEHDIFYVEKEVSSADVEKVIRRDGIDEDTPREVREAFPESAKEESLSPKEMTAVLNRLLISEEEKFVKPVRLSDGRNYFSAARESDRSGKESVNCYGNESSRPERFEDMSVEDQKAIYDAVRNAYSYDRLEYFLDMETDDHDKELALDKAWKASDGKIFNVISTSPDYPASLGYVLSGFFGSGKQAVENMDYKDLDSLYSHLLQQKIARTMKQYKDVYKGGGLNGSAFDIHDTERPRQRFYSISSLSLDDSGDVLMGGSYREDYLNHKFSGMNISALGIDALGILSDYAEDFGKSVRDQRGREENFASRYDTAPVLNAKKGDRFHVINDKGDSDVFVAVSDSQKSDYDMQVVEGYLESDGHQDFMDTVTLIGMTEAYRQAEARESGTSMQQDDEHLYYMFVGYIYKDSFGYQPQIVNDALENRDYRKLADLAPLADKNELDVDKVYGYSRIYTHLPADSKEKGEGDRYGVVIKHDGSYSYNMLDQHDYAEVYRKYTRQELLDMIRKMSRNERIEWIRSGKLSPAAKELFEEVSRSIREKHKVNPTGAPYPALSDDKFTHLLLDAYSLPDEEKCKLMSPTVFRLWTEGDVDREEKLHQLRSELQEGLLPAERKYFAEYSYLHDTLNRENRAGELLYTRVFSVTDPEKVRAFKEILSNGQQDDTDAVQKVIAGKSAGTHIDLRHTYTELPSPDNGEWLPISDSRNLLRAGIFTDPKTGRERIDAYNDIIGQEVKDYMLEDIGYESLKDITRPRIESETVSRLHDDILADRKDLAIARTSTLAQELPDGFEWHRNSPEDANASVSAIIENSKDSAVIDKVSTKDGSLSISGIDYKGHAAVLDPASLTVEDWDSLRTAMVNTQKNREEKHDREIQQQRGREPEFEKRYAPLDFTPGNEYKVHDEYGDDLFVISASDHPYFERNNPDMTYGFLEVKQEYGYMKTPKEDVQAAHEAYEQKQARRDHTMMQQDPGHIYYALTARIRKGIYDGTDRLFTQKNWEELADRAPLDGTPLENGVDFTKIYSRFHDNQENIPGAKAESDRYGVVIKYDGDYKTKDNPHEKQYADVYTKYTANEMRNIIRGMSQEQRDNVRGSLSPDIEPLFSEVEKEIRQEQPQKTASVPDGRNLGDWHQMPQQLQRAFAEYGQTLSRWLDEKAGDGTARDILPKVFYARDTYPVNSLMLSIHSQLDGIKNPIFVTEDKLKGISPDVRTYGEGFPYLRMTKEGIDVVRAYDLSQTNLRQLAGSDPAAREAYDELTLLPGDQNTINRDYSLAWNIALATKLGFGVENILKPGDDVHSWPVRVIPGNGYDLDRKKSVYYDKVQDVIVASSPESNQIQDADARRDEVMSALAKSILLSRRIKQASQHSPAYFNAARLMNAIQADTDFERCKDMKTYKLTEPFDFSSAKEVSDRLKNDPGYARELLTTSASVTMTIESRAGTLDTHLGFEDKLGRPGDSKDIGESLSQASENAQDERKDRQEETSRGISL